MSGRKSSLDDGSRCTDFDDEERLQLEKDIEVLQKKICEFEVYLMQMNASLGGIFIGILYLWALSFLHGQTGLTKETNEILT